MLASVKASYAQERAMERASEREKSLALCMTCEWPCNCCAHGRAAAHGPVTCATAAASEVKRASTFSYHAHSTATLAVRQAPSAIPVPSAPTRVDPFIGSSTGPHEAERIHRLVTRHRPRPGWWPARCHATCRQSLWLCPRCGLCTRCGLYTRCVLHQPDALAIAHL